MKNKIKYLIPSVISFIILAIIYYFNDLYPFGVKNLVQVDADYIYIPVLYKIWDFLHVGGNIFYSDIGLGNAIYGSLIIQGSLYSPLNILLFLVDRNNIVSFFGIFIIIKICLISLTCYIYIDNKYKNINYFYKVLFSVLYSFCGFVIFNYFNDIWLDIVILFPLVVLYLDKLLTEGNEIGYIIVLSLALIISFYFSFFVVVFIIFYSFVHVYLSKKKDIKKTVFKLGKCTVIALLISAFSSIPLMYQIFQSSRFNGYMFANMFTDLKMKSLYLLFCPLFILLFFKLVSKFKKDKVNIFRYVILMILYVIPVIINPINALMHGGNYWGLPYRYGFIPAFILMDASLYYISKYLKEKRNKNILFDSLMSLLIIIIGGIGIYLNIEYRNNIITEGILLDISTDIYIKIIYILIIIYFIYVMALLIKTKYLRWLFLSIISVYSIGMFTSWTIYHNSGYFLCNNAQDVLNNFNLKKDGRYKIEYDSYTPYYGYIFDVDALDNWVHIGPENILDTYKKLGYYLGDDRTYSYGGTIFSDYLLNFKYMFSKIDKSDDDMFTLIQSYNNKKLYEINYNNSYGIIFDEYEDIEYLDRFDYQNKIYHNLFNKNKDIIKYEYYYNDDTDEITINYNIDNPGYLYLDVDNYDNIKYVIVGGNYYNNINNYIKYLGYYDSDFDVTIHFDNKYYTDFKLGFIEKKDIENLSSNIEYKDNKYYVNSDGEKYMFLPINNITGIHVYNNGKEIETYNYLNNFICFKINDGENVISVKYELPVLRISIIFSIIGIILLIFKNKIIFNNLMLNITYWIYMIFVFLVFLYLYFYPLFKYVL